MDKLVQNYINVLNNLPIKSGCDIHYRANMLQLLSASLSPKANKEFRDRAIEKADAFIKKYFKCN